jgi:FkbM family methyltransferase
MKKILFKLISRLGYKIERKVNHRKIDADYFSKYNSKNVDILIKSKNYIHALEQKYPDFNLQAEKEGFLLSFDLFKFYIEGNEEFYILNEVFVNHDYHFESPKKSILIDIGANIGIASIYMSKIQSVEKIYAFEPVEVTFKQAIYNLSINNISEKVDIKNFGLGDSNKKSSFKFDPNSKGSAGLSSVKSDRYIGNINAVEIEVDIRNSYDICKDIIEQYPNHQIVIKMDCEGAENEILSALLKNNLISKIDLFMIEWHHDNFEFVSKLLKDHDFGFFTKNERPQAGLILAFNNKKR